MPVHAPIQVLRHSLALHSNCSLASNLVVMEQFWDWRGTSLSKTFAITVQRNVVSFASEVRIFLHKRHGSFAGDAIGEAAHRSYLMKYALLYIESALLRVPVIQPTCQAFPSKGMRVAVMHYIRSRSQLYTTVANVR